MKILSLNMWQGRLERVLLKHLEELEVDFACTQEAISYEGDTAGLATSFTKVGESLRCSEQFFTPLMHTKFGDKGIYFGNAIFSKIAFDKTETTFTRGLFKEDFDFDNDDYNIRAFQHAEITIDGKKLHLLNHHGHHINDHKLGNDETMRQILVISDYIKSLDGAVILCGDFNLSPNSESIKTLSDILQNLSVSYGLQTTRSKLTTKKEVCDYIFINEHVQANEFIMDETIISDHNALILDFHIK